MKKIDKLLFIFLCAMCSAQVQIGTGTDDTQSIPFDPYYNYSYSQSIYLSEEINASGSITGIEWFFSGNSSMANSQPIKIYLKETTKDVFTENSDWIPINEMTLVYEGGLNMPNGGQNWVSVNLNNAFQYNGGNIAIAVLENNTGYNDVHDDFLCHATLTERSLFFMNDNIVPNPNNPPVGSKTKKLPNIIFNGLQINCEKPTNIEASNIQLNNASISWEGNINSSESFSISYGVHPIQPNEGVQIDNITANNIALDNLSAETKYDVFVKKNCDNGYSSVWSNKFIFNTLCNATDLPYLLDFQNSNNMISTCNNIETISGNPWIITSPNGISGFDAGGKLTYKYHNSFDANAWFYTKGLNLESSKTYKLTFKAAKYNSHKTEKLKIKIGQVSNSASMNTEIANFQDLPMMNDDGSVNHTRTFTVADDGVYYIGFQSLSEAGNYYIYIDDISITEENLMGTEETPLNGSTKIYPNPTKDIINIHTTSTIERIEIFNTLGQKLKNTTIDKKKKVNIDLSNFTNGVYSVKIITKEGTIIKQVIKQ